MKTEETEDMSLKIVLISMLVGNAVLIGNIQSFGGIVPIGIMITFVCILLTLIVCIVTGIDQIFLLIIREKLELYGTNGVEKEK